MLPPWSLEAVSVEPGRGKPPPAFLPRAVPDSICRRKGQAIAGSQFLQQYRCKVRVVP